MTALKYVIVGIQIVLSLILVVVVLFQHGSQRGLSGSIAGGAETFFGKNKGRTIDAKLKRWTAVVAVLFLISSIALNIVIDQEDKANQAALQAQVEQQAKEQQNEEDNKAKEQQAQQDENNAEDENVEDDAQNDDSADSETDAE